MHAKTTFAVVSDIHFALNGQDKGQKFLASGRSIIPRVLDEINNNKEIDFVIFTGDLLVDPFPAELKELPALIALHLKKPYFVVPGNHDRATDAHRKKGLDVLELSDFVKAFHGHPYNSNKSYWSADVGDLHLVGLDTTMASTWGGIVPDEEMRWLKKDLKRNKNKFTIVFSHHGLTEYYPEMNFEKEYFISNHEDMRKLFDENRQVKFAVNGHYHFPAASFKHGVHYLTAPSIISYPLRYAIVEVDGGCATFKTMPSSDEALVQKAAMGLTQEADWRKQFDTDANEIDLFRGITRYEFDTRSN